MAEAMGALKPATEKLYNVLTPEQKKIADDQFRLRRHVGCSRLDRDWHRRWGLRALQSEDKIGTMLPCNVVFREHPDDRVEVPTVDPVALMEAVKNPGLEPIAGAVGEIERKF